jgi:hypothetical protein
MAGMVLAGLSRMTTGTGFLGAPSLGCDLSRDATLVGIQEDQVREVGGGKVRAVSRGGSIIIGKVSVPIGTHVIFIDIICN